MPRVVPSQVVTFIDGIIDGLRGVEKPRAIVVVSPEDARSIRDTFIGMWLDSKMVPILTVKGLRQSRHL